MRENTTPQQPKEQTSYLLFHVRCEKGKYRINVCIIDMAVAPIVGVQNESNKKKK